MIPSFTVLLSFISFIILEVTADFHISLVQENNRPGGHFVACPSDYLNCQCWYGDRAGHVEGDQLGDYFQISAGLCGMGKMDFYKRDGAHYDFYVDGGDGTLQGQCYFNSFSSACGDGVLVDDLIVDQLVCYSYICNP